MAALCKTNLSHVKRSHATDSLLSFWSNNQMTKIKDYSADNVLADNLRRMVFGRHTSVTAWAKEMQLEPRNIQRIINGDQSPSVTVLNSIASHCGLFAWQLLVPDLDVANPPVSLMNKQERDLYSKIKQDFTLLPP
jgi:hypothetical protein